MKKEKAIDYSIAELAKLANTLDNEAQDDYEFEAVDQIVFHIAHRLCEKLDAPFTPANDVSLEDAIEMAERL